MLRECRIQTQEKELPVREAEAFLKAQCSGSEVTLYEGETEAKLVSLDALDPDRDLPRCQRIVVSDRSTEIRLERSQTGDVFYCRIVREYGRGSRAAEDRTDGTWTDCVVREDTLLFREGRQIAEAYYRKGAMLVREYYREDVNGMLVFVTDRLAGVVD